MAKERVIYSNYDLWEDYAESAKEYLMEEYPEDGEPSENAIWEEIYTEDSINWEDEFAQLQEYFDGVSLICFGSVGRWDGSFPGGRVFYDFKTLFFDATEDCAYWKLWDENGHLYLECSHHDGTNSFEIKTINDTAVHFIDNWEYSPDDNRTEEEIHKIIVESNFFSALPHYAHNVFGCPKYKKR